MALVFGRERVEEHPLEEALEDLLTAGVGPATRAGNRALARNLQQDPRVSPERERAFLEVIGEIRSGRDLRNELSRYFKEKVRFQEKPEYVSTRLNGINLVTGTPTGAKVHPDLFLARVLDLNGLTVPFLWAHRQGWPEFDDFRESSLPPEEMTSWLDDQLTLLGPEVFVPTVLRLLDERRGRYPFQPTWAVLWTEVEEVLNTAPPHRWLESLGVPKPRIGPDSGRWLVVLRYRVRDVDWLVRPTVLDAGDAPEHFPTPLRAEDEWSKYGHPMDLSLQAPRPSLMKEFIHRQIDHPEEHWTSAGSVCVKAETPTEDGLEEQREAHLGRLRNVYEDDVVDWQAN